MPLNYKQLLSFASSKIYTSYIVLLVVLLLLISPLIPIKKVDAAYRPIRVLFTSTPSPNLARFLQYSNIPYDVRTSFTVEDVVGNYTTIAAVGTGGQVVSNSLEPTIETLVGDHGIGLVYFGWTSTTYPAHNPTIVSIFNINTADYVGNTTSGNIDITDTSHFITSDYENFLSLTTNYSSQIGNITSYTENGEYPKFLAHHGAYKALIINEYQNGRAVWFNFNSNTAALTEGRALKAFVNSLIWTSEPTIGKHFAFSSIPNYFSMRVDDVQGAEAMFKVAESKGLKLTNFLFVRDVANNADNLEVIKEYYNKNHSMGVHSPNNTEHYFWDPDGLTEEQIAANFNEFRDYFDDWGLRQPTTFIPSQHKILSTVFPKLVERGLFYHYGECTTTTDGIAVVDGEPFQNDVYGQIDIWNTLASEVYCFKQPRPGANESLQGGSLDNDVLAEKKNIEAALNRFLPIILVSHEYSWQNKTQEYLSSWLDQLIPFLNSKIPGWNSLAGEFLAPMIVQHKNISVTSAQFDSDTNKYQITIDGTNTVPVPVTIYEPNSIIKGWDGTKQIIQNGDYYHLFVPAGTGSRTFTVELDSGTATNDFGYIYKVDTLVESTTSEGLGLKVDLYDFGTLDLKGYGGKVAHGSTTIESDGSFTGKSTFSDGSEQWALVPMTINPTGGPVDVIVNTWNSDGDYYKEWTETASSGVTTEHVVGDLKLNQTYQVKVDGEVYTTVTSDGSGQIAFTYSGGYSTKTFAVEEYNAPAPTSTPESTSISSSAKPPSCDAAPPSGNPWLYGTIARSATSVELYFTDADEPYDHYALEYGTSPGEYQWGATNIGGRGSRTYIVDSLQPNTTYYFRVRAGNGCATGEWSNELSATTKAKVTAFSVGGLDAEIIDVQTKEGVTERQIDQEDLESEEQAEQVEEERLGYDVNIKLVDEKKEPVLGATITLYSTPRETTTNEDGVARFKNVEPGEHRVVITHNGQTGEQKINVSGDSDVDEIDFTIQIKATSPLLDPWVMGVVATLAIAVLAASVMLVRSRSPKSR